MNGDSDNSDEGESTSNQQIFGIEQNRRITSIHTTARLKDEIRKAEQGQSSEHVIDELFDDLHQVTREMDKVESMRTMRIDGETLDNLILFSATQVEGLKDETLHTLDTGKFISRMKTFAQNHKKPGDLNHFATLSRHFGFILRRVPDFHYLRPCFELKDEGPYLRPKTERKRTVRIKGESQTVQGKTLRELKEGNAGDEEGGNGQHNSVNKELDNVRRHLRRFYKQTGSNSVDYYKFVLNPESFGETVENMFYVSFLMKDGQVRLNIDTHGTPSIVKLSREEIEERIQGGQLSERLTTQVVPKLDYGTWKQLVAQLNIEKALITRRVQ